MAGAPERARELLQVERVAAAVVVDGVGRVAEQPACLVAVQRSELEPGQRARAVRALERRQQPLGHLARADGERDQHRPRGRAPQQRADQLERAGVGPVQIVEREHERLARGQHAEQLAHGVVRAVTLVRQ